MIWHEWLVVALLVVVTIGALVREWQWRAWTVDVDQALDELAWFREITPGAKAIYGDRTARSVAVWLIVGALALVDHHGPHVGQHAAVFAVIINALIWIGNAIAAAGTYIAVTLEVFVQYVWEVLGWLTRRVADVLSNTGAMFSRVWESARQFYDGVLKPALIWLHDFYGRIRDWLTKVLKPVLQWAYRVRDELRSLYKRFVKPILDALDTTRKVLDVLTKLHVPFARQLDTYVTKTEQVISENYLRLVGIVNKTIDTINGILTLDGYLQRFLFLRTMERDVFYVWRQLVNTRTKPLSSADLTAAGVAGKGKTIATARAELREYWTSQTGQVAGDVAAASLYWRQQFAHAAPADFSEPTA